MRCQQCLPDFTPVSAMRLLVVVVDHSKRNKIKHSLALVAARLAALPCWLQCLALVLPGTWLVPLSFQPTLTCCQTWRCKLLVVV